MKVLVACEYSGRVRDAFRALGHDAYSCDIIPADVCSNYHIQSDCLEVAYNKSYGWDLMIAHPPCTYLTCSAEWAYKDLPIMINGKVKNLDPNKLYGEVRRKARDEAVDFFMQLIDAPIEKIAIENPVGVMSSRYRKPNQTIHPYEFGEDASKRTCLWLKGLQELSKKPEDRFEGRMVEWPKGSGKMVERWSNQTDSGQSNVTPSDDR